MRFKSGFTWLSNHMTIDGLDEITYQLPNFNGATAEVLE